MYFFNPSRTIGFSIDKLERDFNETYLTQSHCLSSSSPILPTQKCTQPDSENSCLDSLESTDSTDLCSNINELDDNSSISEYKSYGTSVSNTEYKGVDYKPGIINNLPLNLDALNNEEYLNSYLPSLPWYKRPSVLFILPVYFFAAVETSMLPAVSMELMGKIICNQIRPSSGLPFDDNKCIESPIVEARLSELLTYGKIITGMTSLFVIPYICKLSDRVGRRQVLLYIHYSLFISVFCDLFCWFFRSNVSYYTLLLGSVFDGIANSVVVMNLLSAYVADCIVSEKRTVALAQVFCGTTLGYIAGPTLGGVVYSISEDLKIPYYVCLGLIVLSTLSVWGVFPESQSATALYQAKFDYQKQKMADARILESNGNSLWASFKTAVSWLNKSVVRPYKDMISVFRETKSKDDRRNLTNIVVIEIFYAILSFGLDDLIINYFFYRVGATVEQLNYAIVVSAILRVVSLGLSSHMGAMIKWISETTGLIRYGENAANNKIQIQDIYVIRLANILETLALCVIGFSGANYWGAVCGFWMIGFGMISRPNILSSMINLVPEGQVGKFMGSKGPFEVLVSVVGSSVLLSFYAFLVNLKASHGIDLTSLVFYVCAAFYFVTVLVSFRFRL